ncbi:MAG: DUF6264 family protein [Pseudolysinimonas sp.]|uniref:DUF6264 family protein n=1 Tax=Pseudolysinimonas sp. TaxID=2680009 RepID=UPI003C71E7AB
MSDPRPAPQYGEYATPEEVAALRGTVADPPAAPAPTPAPVARTSGASGAPRGSTLRRMDRPLTIALIAFGVLNLIQYAGPLLDFEYFLEVATQGTFADAIDFGDAARIGGVVLFVVCLGLLLASSAIAVLRLRRGRLAFWVPLVAGAFSVLAWVAVLVVIVLQTPGAVATSGF